MHMLICNFLRQMQHNPPADTTAQLLLRKQEQEKPMHSKVVKSSFTNHLSELSLKAALVQKGTTLHSQSSLLFREQIHRFQDLLSAKLLQSKVNQRAVSTSALATKSTSVPRRGFHDHGTICLFSGASRHLLMICHTQRPGCLSYAGSVN